MPPDCRPFVVHDFPTLEDIASEKGILGNRGGSWSACSHLSLFGINFMPFTARYLAFHLKPRTALEFGCGLGTTADFLARFTPGGAEVVCLEPHPMLGEVFDRRASPRPTQLALSIFEPEAKACVAGLESHQYDLVYSFEVLEHVPFEHHAKAIETLVRATGKWLVFAAARPDQGGLGHLPESSFTRDEWIAKFTAAGLAHMPLMSAALRRTAKPERDYDLSVNTIVFGNPGAGLVDSDFVPDVAGDRWYPWDHTRFDNVLIEENVLFCPRQDEACAVMREVWRDGQTQALWPELDLLRKKVKAKELVCPGSTGESTRP